MTTTEAHVAVTSAGREEDSLSFPTCRNCGGRLSTAPGGGTLPYCPHCGQRATGRIALSDLREAFASYVMNLERGLAHTVFGLLRSPGAVVAEYLAGRRRSYVDPYAYLLLWAAISLLLFNLAGGVDAMELREDLSATFEATRGDLEVEQRERLVEANVTMTEYTALWSLLLSIPLALFLRLFYRHTLNLAESLVYAVFLMGQVFLLDLATYLLLPFASDSNVHLSATQAVYAITAIWFGATFSKPRWLSALKTFGALVLAYLLFIQLVAIALEIWVRAF